MTAASMGSWHDEADAPAPADEVGPFDGDAGPGPARSGYTLLGLADAVELTARLAGDLTVDGAGYYDVGTHTRPADVVAEVISALTAEGYLIVRPVRE